jgi:hypothetical protein
MHGSHICVVITDLRYATPAAVTFLWNVKLQHSGREIYICLAFGFQALTNKTFKLGICNAILI